MGRMKELYITTKIVEQNAHELLRLVRVFERNEIHLDEFIAGVTELALKTIHIVEGF